MLTKRKPPVAGFKKGMKKPPNSGRKKGVKNHATVEAKEVCASIVDSPTYRRKLKARALAGELPPAVETMLWAYAKGKPVERVETGKPGDFAKLSDKELKAGLVEALKTL